MAVKPDGTANPIRNKVASVIQKLAFKQDGDGVFTRLVSVSQKLALKPKAVKATHEEVTQKVAVKQSGTANPIRIVVVSVIQKVAFKATETIRIGRVVQQKVAFAQSGSRIRRRLKKRSVTQKVAFKQTARPEAEISMEVTQKVGIKPDADTTGFTLFRTVRQKLAFKTGHIVGGFVSVTQKVGIKPKVSKAIAESVEQKVAFKDSADKDRIVHRTEDQKVGIKPEGEKKRIQHKEAENKLAIKPDADKDRVVPAEVDQKVAVKDSADIFTKLSRTVVQKLRFHVSSAPELPSDAPIFKFKNAVRRIFRV